MNVPNFKTIALSTAWLFFIFYKMTELGLVIADYHKIDDCVESYVYVGDWLYISSIGGLLICAYYIFHGINSYLLLQYTLCSDSESNSVDMNSGMSHTFIVLTSILFQILWSVLGTISCFNLCKDVGPKRIHNLMISSVFVNFGLLAGMIATIMYHNFVKNFIHNNSSILGGDSYYFIN